MEVDLDVHVAIDEVIETKIWPLDSPLRATTECGQRRRRQGADAVPRKYVTPRVDA